MTSRLDDLIAALELEPPEGFSQRVIKRLELLPQAGRDRGSPAWLPWAAVIGGAVLALDEFASFMFSAWLAAAVH